MNKKRICQARRMRLATKCPYFFALSCIFVVRPFFFLSSLQYILRTFFSQLLACILVTLFFHCIKRKCVRISVQYDSCRRHRATRLLNSPSLTLPMSFAYYLSSSCISVARCFTSFVFIVLICYYYNNSNVFIVVIDVNLVFVSIVKNGRHSDK